MLDFLPKYYYKPILEKVKETYLINAQVEYVPGFDIESAVTLIIEADSEESADKARFGFIDKGMWNLEKVEDEDK